MSAAKTLGLVGFGEIGTEVAKRAAALTAAVMIQRGLAAVAGPAQHVIGGRRMVEQLGQAERCGPDMHAQPRRDAE